MYWVVILRLEVRNSYVCWLENFTFGGKISYVWGLRNLTFGV